jgi:prepilin-type N-terminal cleavage/methylation domain-containing protein
MVDLGFWIVAFGFDTRHAYGYCASVVDEPDAPRIFRRQILRNPKFQIQNPKLPPRASRAFTLLEVLIAIALVLALGAALFGFLHDMLATRARTLEHAMQQRTAATLIERLETDIAGTLVGDARSGAGVQGDATHLRMLTRGVMPQLASRGLDDPAPLGDLQIVEFHFDAAARRLEARRASASASQTPGDFATLGGEVAHVRLRYLDGGRWQSSFDSLALDRLPAAVEVAVWFNAWPQDQTLSPSDSIEADLDVAASDRSVSNFDERAFGMISDSESQRAPPPDRLRVIVIPDGGSDSADQPTSARIN